jgi:hypothetical protein
MYQERSTVWAHLAELIRERLLLARLAGAALWLAWLLSLALGGWAHDRPGHRVGADHVQYYVVGRLVDEGAPELIYDAETMRQRQAEVGGPGWQGYLPFRYPPFYALCFAPTSRLSYEASWLLWTALGLLVWAGSGWLLGAPWRTGLVWSACFFPVFAAVSFGQNSLISLAILSAAGVLWLRDRPLAAGLVAGLLAFKPHLALGLGLLWLLDARRSWPALLGLAATTGALAALGWLAIPRACEAVLASLGGNVSTSDPLSLPWNMGSQGFWELLLPGQTALPRRLSLATSAAGLAVLVALWWQVRQRRAMALAVAVLLTPWLTPYLMVYDWTILLLPAVLLWRECRGDGRSGEPSRTGSSAARLAAPTAATAPRSLARPGRRCVAGRARRASAGDGAGPSAGPGPAAGPAGAGGGGARPLPRHGQPMCWRRSSSRAASAGVGWPWRSTRPHEGNWCGRRSDR